jgi:hypothetical protein
MATAAGTCGVCGTDDSSAPCTKTASGRHWYSMTDTDPMPEQLAAALTVPAARTAEQHALVAHSLGKPRALVDVLLRAALLIEEHGWCQRQSRTGSGALCPVAAIAAAAAGDKDLEHRAQTALERWVIWNSHDQSVASWNDAPERTRDEVLAALRGAVSELDS